MEYKIIEDAIQKLKAEKEVKKAQVEQIVHRDKILPFNQDIDSKLHKAILEVQANADKEKAEFAKKAEKTKNDFAVSAISLETAKVDSEYDVLIGKLEKLLPEVKE